MMDRTRLLFAAIAGFLSSPQLSERKSKGKRQISNSRNWRQKVGTLFFFIFSFGCNKRPTQDRKMALHPNKLLPFALFDLPFDFS